MAKENVSHYLNAASGYLDLEMLPEAQRELEAIAAEEQNRPEVLRIWVEIFRRRERWPEMERVARQLVKVLPDEVAPFILWAYATRRSQSIQAAQQILQQAALLFPKDPTIAFNLGCYLCLLGDMAGARQWVEQSIQFDLSFQKLAIADEDLRPLWDYFGKVFRIKQDEK